jgi:predicted nucleic acid-binding protein
MKIVLDTNIYSAYRKGNPRIQSILESAVTVYMPAIVLGELYAGFFGGTHYEKNIVDLITFLSKPGIEEMPVSHPIAERYGQLHADLRKRGRPLPTNDIWIAATALETGSRLITLDKHFEEVPGLVVHWPGN